VLPQNLRQPRRLQGEDLEDHHDDLLIVMTITKETYGSSIDHANEFF